nr:cathepsin D-like [Oncorhynchus nerka]
MKVLYLCLFAALALASDALVRIPLRKFRSIRRTLTDSGRAAEELLAGQEHTKYNNLGFPSSSNGPTPETLKNFMDVRRSSSCY